MQKRTIKAVLGTNNFGLRINLTDGKKIANHFMNFNESEKTTTEFDTAACYANGNSETLLGEMDLKSNANVQIATKASPWEGNTFTKTALRKQLEDCLDRLQMKSVQIFYLHAPDQTTPIIETLQTMNDLYLEGKFKEFGLSNYASWQVAEICTICKANGWISPTVYQGMYNSLTRMVEKELFSCLRHFNIRFYAYNPLCAGLLTGKHKFEDANKTGPGRFYGEGSSAVGYRKIYWKKDLFTAVEKIQQALRDVYGNKVSITEASLRWVFHHSKLDADKGDTVILGCSSFEQYLFNIKCINNGRLHDSVVVVYDECWKDCCFVSTDGHNAW